MIASVVALGWDETCRSGWLGAVPSTRFSVLGAKMMNPREPFCFNARGRAACGAMPKRRVVPSVGAIWWSLYSALEALR